jgi:hypothetical protein
LILVETVPFYIQKGNKIKKVILPKDQVSLTRLKDVFHSRFSGLVAVDIYILDPNSNINYELESMDDVKPYSILSVKGKVC